MKKLKGNRDFLLITIGIGLASAFLSLFLYLWSPSFLREVDLRYGDFRFDQRGAREPDSEVVVVAIDEKSINELGRWQWSRKLQAELVEKLLSYEPKVAAFDIIYSEPESEEADSLLASALEQGRNVILGYFFRDEATEIPSRESLRQIKGSSIKLVKILEEPMYQFLKSYPNVELNIAQIGEAARGFGFFNMLPDTDGIFRSANLLLAYEGDTYPSLTLESIKRYLKGEILLTIASYGVENIVIRNMEIPTDENGRFLLNFYGPAGTFTTYSAVDVLRGRIPPEALNDKLLFVGATEIGIYDVRATPLDPVFPGVEIHATVASNILERDFLIKNNLTQALDIALLVLIPLILVFLLMGVQSTLLGTGIALFLLLLHLLGNYLLFAEKNLVLSAVYPALSLGFAYVFFEGYRNLVIERRSRYLRRAFSNYVSPQVVSEILADPDKLALGGASRNITLLFSDIRGFTTLSERTAPEELVTLLNEYLNPMTEIVMEEGGTLDKYIGDAVMAIFGAPLDVPDHPERACRAALHMHERLKTLNEAWEGRGLSHISIGVGINTGEAVVGNMGANMRFDYTAIGDTVNLASRLEGLTKFYGVDTVISKSTAERLGDSKFILRELDCVAVKGKEEPVAIFELTALQDETSEKSELISSFNQALYLYREKQFYEAKEKFSEILKKFPDDEPSSIYLERCSQYISQPPADGWDGVYVAKEK